MSQHDSDSNQPGSVMDPARRRFLQATGVAGASGLAAGLLPAVARAAGPVTATHLPNALGPADATVHIGRALVELAPGRTIVTTGYNDQVPGPLLRLKEGRQFTMDIHNDTDVPDTIHPHGQIIPVAADGTPEEASPYVPAHGVQRIRYTPGPSGFRFQHTHIYAGEDLHRGTYTGEHGIVYIEPRDDPGRYDEEVFLVTHEWEPFFTSEGEEDERVNMPPLHRGQHDEESEEGEESQNGKANGLEIGYRLFSINGKMLGHGEPVRVREGQRVLFHIVNASATEHRRFALPGHTFKVVALDGNPVPRPADVDALELGPAERISAIVEMKHPGVWIFGSVIDEDRRRGMGIVVEYAGKSGKPQWGKPGRKSWDYTLFGSDKPPRSPDDTIKLVFGKINGGKGGFNRWTVNGKTFQQQTRPIRLDRNKRYRIVCDNTNDDPHPLHLHRVAFELTNIEGKRTSGIMKDVVMIRPNGHVEFDFDANHAGLHLFHCHNQQHLDYGFATLFDVV